MVDIIFPPNLNIAQSRIRYVDSTGVSVGEFTGVKKTASKGGDRLGASVEATRTGGATLTMERAQWIAFLNRLRARQNRVYLPDHSRKLRGSFPAPETIPNNTFENGTTGFDSGSEYTITASDRTVRARRNAMTATAYALRPSSNVTVTQYAPYVARYMVMQGRGAYSGGFRIDDIAGSVNGSTSSGFGLKTQVFIPLTTNLRPGLTDLDASGQSAGDYLLIPYASMSRSGGLVDNGVNLVLRSDEIDNAAWTKTATTVTANAFTAPDGTATGDRLVETTANSSHAVEQSYTKDGVSRDYFCYGYFRAGSLAAARNRVQLVMYQGAGADTCSAVFDLTNGTIASGPTVTGAVTNGRAAVVDVGGGWYLCWVGARSTTSTSLIWLMRMVQSGTTVSYTGQTTSDVGLWRCGLSDSPSATGGSNVPGRPVQTTTASVNGSTAQTGSALYIKGLPASTNGLLYEGDSFEVITSRGSEFKYATAALNSDAAGLGYLQFEPPLRGTPSDSAAIIVCNPLGRFLFTGEMPEWSNEPGFITTASLDFEEAA